MKYRRKKLTFAISSPDEFLYIERRRYETTMQRVIRDYGTLQTDSESAKKRLSYRRGTARHPESVEILSTTAQLYAKIAREKT